MTENKNLEWGKNSVEQMKKTTENESRRPGASVIGRIHVKGEVDPLEREKEAEKTEVYVSLTVNFKNTHCICKATYVLYLLEQI